mgnify:CR=1 FL=1
MGLERQVTYQKLEESCYNESETGQFRYELGYPLCFVEYNCTTSQGKFICINVRCVT